MSDTFHTGSLTSALRVAFPAPHYATDVAYNLEHDAYILRVRHIDSNNALTQFLDTRSVMAANITDLLVRNFETMNFNLSQAIARETPELLDAPYEPGNEHHEEIRILCYLAGYELLRDVPPSAVFRGDELVYLTPIANRSSPKWTGRSEPELMPKGCMQLPIDYWRSVLTNKIQGKQIP